MQEVLIFWPSEMTVECFNVITSIALQQSNPEMQDRAEVLQLSDRFLLAVADGAGGIAGGSEAAELFVRRVRESAASLNTPDDCRRFLTRIDRELADAKDCGETTGVITVVHPQGIFGVSVGDSMAWMFSANGRVELTRGQQRKPFLGTGVAYPWGFTSSDKEGTIVVATDGLWKYTGIELIEQRVHDGEANCLADQLSELVRLRSGTFPDDVAIITCRIPAS